MYSEDPRIKDSLASPGFPEYTTTIHRLSPKHLLLQCIVFFFLFNGAAPCQTRLPFILSFKLPYLYHKVERLPG